MFRYSTSLTIRRMRQPTQENTTVERRARARLDAAKAAHHDAVFTLARASEAHDQDTGAHILRIRLIVERLAIHLGLTPGDASDLGCDAMLHDVGKLHVPVEILRKPGQLTQGERQIMESHTNRGRELLADRPSLQRAADIAQHHHENWNGTGYPAGLMGQDIPLPARITAAADVLDALIAQRCYKQSWPYEVAIREVIALSGTKLDPTVVQALERCESNGGFRDIFELPVRSEAFDRQNGESH
jgi:putative two-component system response regulator